IRDPAVLERIDRCRTIVLDKTGTLTYGTPTLTERLTAPGIDDLRVLQLAASLERYSKHPLSKPILQAAERAQLATLDVTELREPPGAGLEGIVDGHRIGIVGRRQGEALGIGATLPPIASGLECIVVMDGAYAATYRFRDAAREDSRSFIRHLGPRHQSQRILLVSGDRESEVRYLAEHVGSTDVYAERKPAAKVTITRQETAHAPTLFIG